MKKLLCLMLALLLLCGAASAETVFSASDYDVIATLPEGYAMSQSLTNDDGMLVASFRGDEDDALLMLVVAEDPAYAGYTLTRELSDKEYAELVTPMTADYAAPVVTFLETEAGTPLICIREEGSASEYATIYTIYQGWIVQLWLQPAAGTTELPEDVVDVAVELLSGMQMVRK